MTTFRGDHARTIVIIPVYRDATRIVQVLDKFTPGLVDQVCVIVDEPGPGVLGRVKEAAQKAGITSAVMQNPVRRGIGYAIKQGYDYALSYNFDVIVVMAGNGKDDPREIPRLTEPILKRGYDYVQGSRYLPGGKRVRNPFLRRIFTRLFPVFWTLLTGVHCTDVTNGFRAYRAFVLDDPAINIRQDWLDKYQLEYYLHYKVLTLGYKVIETPVSKIYPEERRGYSQISPFKDWWQIVGPILLLRLGAKK